MVKKYIKKRVYRKRRPVIGTNKKRIYKKKYRSVIPKTPSYKSSVEKKFVETRSTGSATEFGKNSSGTSSGHLMYQYDNTTASNVNQFFPRITQGTDYNDRVGNEIKLTGLYLNCRVSGQGQFRSGGEYRIIIFGKKYDTCQLTSNFNLNEFLDYDRMENEDIYTLSSQRNPEFYRKFIVYYNKKFKLGPDQYYSNVNIPVSGDPPSYYIPQQDMFRDHHIKIKLNRSVKYDRKELQSTYATLAYGDLVLLVLANKGRNSDDTGFEWNHYCRWYFTDS